MSSQEKHDERVEHNKRFYDRVISYQFSDWEIVVSYYCAVHMIESALATMDKHPSSHQERRDMVIDSSPLIPQNVYKAYMKLEELSRNARYAPDIDMTDVELRFAQSKMDEICRWYDGRRRQQASGRR